MILLDIRDVKVLSVDGELLRQLTLDPSRDYPRHLTLDPSRDLLEAGMSG